ncbi:MAG: fibro-slime domain-containing protein [Fibrobacteres bacterium]|nr:fibro-slime domain-containing protein [Fibrobacterota bacterium]
MKGPRGNGFVLPLTILLVLGVTAISVGILFNGRMGRMSTINYKNKIRTFMAVDGMVTLLAQELINGNSYKYVDSTRTGRIQGHIWSGMGGNSVANFMAAIPSTPFTDTLSSPYLGSNLNQSNYGLKWTGWLMPPITGAYTFITRSDDESRFYLSTDAEQGHLSASPICSIEPGWVVSWPTTGQAVSGPIGLVAGTRYYFEYYHKQGGGWDVGQLGWSGPEYFAERPISGQYLSQYKTDPEYNGLVQLGGVPVRFRVGPMGLDAFRISAEAVLTRPGNASDTAYRLPLEQMLSLKGPPIPAPPHLFLRVIHHDFLSKIHPEFDMPGAFSLGVFTGMVQPTLSDSTATDAAYFGRAHIPKPLHAANTPNYGCGVNKWFKDWTLDQWDYAYTNPSDCNKTKFNAAGTTYQNVKIYDSLQFDLDESQGPYTYVYSRQGNINTGDPHTAFKGEAEYFPLDWRGQDPAGSGHNFSFCTELHTTFLHQSGLKFEFTGDDDVWAYVDNKLIIDLGGVHASSNAIVSLDDLTGLTYGKTYAFDFFQCERHEFNSTSRIVTNIKMGRPQGAPVTNWHRDYGSMN